MRDVRVAELMLSLTRTRTIADSVGIDVCRSLIGMHACTGCDTVSAFAGKGKARALK